MQNKLSNEVTVGQLTSLFKERFYGVKYIDFEKGEDLKPFDFKNVTDQLIVKGFKVYFDEKDNTTTLLIGVDAKQYNVLKNDKNEGANVTDPEWLAEVDKWK